MYIFYFYLFELVLLLLFRLLRFHASYNWLHLKQKNIYVYKSHIWPSFEVILIKYFELNITLCCRWITATKVNTKVNLSIIIESSAGKGKNKVVASQKWPDFVKATIKHIVKQVVKLIRDEEWMKKKTLNFSQTHGLHLFIVYRKQLGSTRIL